MVDDSHGPPPRRAVLLGASNLTRSISTAVATAQFVCGGPLDVLVAHGHGRSYGMVSSVLGRSLPGIIECGLWPALAARDRAPTAALITDIGNDLFYGAAPERIAGWVESCLDRLAQAGAKVTLARMPVVNLDRVSPWQYQLVRRLLFPGCRLSLAGLSERALALDELLQRLARERCCAWVEPEPRWYGFDPIHVRMRWWPHAWETWLAPWSPQRFQASAPQVRGSLARWMRLRRCAPERRAWFGFEQRRAQPALRLDDGTSLSFF